MPHLAQKFLENISSAKRSFRNILFTIAHRPLFLIQFVPHTHFLFKRMFLVLLLDKSIFTEAAVSLGLFMVINKQCGVL